MKTIAECFVPDFSSFSMRTLASCILRCPVEPSYPRTREDLAPTVRRMAAAKHREHDIVEVRVDPELMLLALNQLVFARKIARAHSHLPLAHRDASRVAFRLTFPHAEREVVHAG